MRNINKLFSEADYAAVSQAIKDAEARSGCEIIPVITDQSGRYDRGEDIFGVMFAMAVPAAAWLGQPQPAPHELAAGWVPAAATPFGLAMLLALIGGGFVTGAVLATLIPALKTPFVAPSEMQEETERAARACFYAMGLRKAPQAAGILIFVSRYEHMVQVLGDDAVQAKLRPEDWQAICDALLDGLRGNRPADGFIAAIAKTGELLDGAFQADGDGTAFADALVILD